MTFSCHTRRWLVVLCATCVRNLTRAHRAGLAAALAAMLCVAALVPPAHAQANSCGQWVSAGATSAVSTYSPARNDGYLNDATEWRGELAAVGNYRYIGGTLANYAARWDGRRWYALGTGLNGDSGAITTYENDLIVGGLFTTAGGLARANIARWNGTTWSAMGAGFDDRVTTLFNLDGEVIAVGRFRASGKTICNGVARWDGAAWQPFGTGTNGNVWGAARFNGELVISGDFTEAGGVPCNRVACWDGANWHPLGAGADDSVYVLAGFKGSLYAFGRFLNMDGAPARVAARWDGASWAALPGVPQNVAYMYCARVFRGELCVGPVNDGLKAAACAYAVRDGMIVPLMRQQLGSQRDGLYTNVNAMAEWRGNLLLVGAFDSHASACGPESLVSNKAGCTLVWDGATTRPLEQGAVAGLAPTTITSTPQGLFAAAASPISSLAQYPLAAPACPANISLSVAEWTGTGIQGTPVGDPRGLVVRALVEYRSAVTALYTTSTLSELRAGVWRSLKPLPYVETGLIEVGGACVWNDRIAVSVRNVPTTGFSTVYTTDGTTVVSLGSPPFLATDLVSWRGQLVAAGATAGFAPGASNAAAVWTGTAWVPLGPVDPASTGDFISALCVYNGDLCAAGTFTRFGGTPQVGVARFDGAQWEFLGATFAATTNTTASPAFRAMVEYGGRLFVGGTFTSFTALGAARACPNRLATWDGGRWEPVADPGTQTDATAVYAMTIHKGELFVAGSFSLFNGTPSGGMVRYTINPVIEVEDQPLDATTCPSGTASLTARTSGITPAEGFTYRWQRPDPDAPDEWVDLDDGPLALNGLAAGVVSGTATATLTLGNPPDPGPTGIALRARCAISNSCGTNHTNAAYVRVQRLDYNCDGAADTDDLGDFITDYFAPVPVAGPGGYAAACPEEPPPFDRGYRATFTPAGSPQCSPPFADNLADFITAYFAR